MFTAQYLCGILTGIGLTVLGAIAWMRLSDWSHQEIAPRRPTCHKCGGSGWTLKAGAQRILRCKECDGAGVR